MIKVNKFNGTSVFFSLSHHLTLSFKPLSIHYLFNIIYGSVMFTSGVIRHLTEQYKFWQKQVEFGLCTKGLTLITHSSHPLSRSTIKVHDWKRIRGASKHSSYCWSTSHLYSWCRSGHVTQEADNAAGPSTSTSTSISSVIQESPNNAGLYVPIEVESSANMPTTTPGSPVSTPPMDPADLPSVNQISVSQFVQFESF